jgi:hypothetical protein
MIAVLLGVDSQALCHELNIDTIDVFNQASDRWEDLLCDIPVDVQLTLPPGGEDLIWMLGFVCQLWVLLVSLEGLFADDIGDEVVNQL